MAYEFNTQKFYNNYEEKVANQKKITKTNKLPEFKTTAVSPTGFNYGSARTKLEAREKKRIKEEEEKALEVAQKAEIESQYQSEMNTNGGREGVIGGVDRVFDVLSTGGYVVNGLLQDGLKGGLEGLKGGLDGFTNKESGKEYSFNDTLDKWSDGKWDNGWDDTWYKKTGKFLANLAGEILLDPTTYLGGAGLVKSLLKGSGTRATSVLGRTAMKEISEDTIINAGKKLASVSGDDASKTVVNVIKNKAGKYTTKANKLAGNVVSKGDMTYGIGKAKITLKGTGDVVRKVGDMTVSPYYNTLADAVRKTNPFRAITNNGKLRQSIVKGDYDEFLRVMSLKDIEIGMREARNSVTNDIIGRANNTTNVFKASASKTNDEAQTTMFNILDNQNSYDINEELEYLGKEGSEMFDNFVSQVAETSPQKMKDTSVKMVLNELKGSTDVIGTLKSPQNKFQQYVYKTLIDPQGNYEHYADAYQDFVSKYHITQKVNKIKTVTPVKNVGEVATKGIKRFSQTDMETGLFVNQTNTKKLGSLFKQNQAISTFTQKPIEGKITYLNDILFDGKPVITMNEATETSINQVVHALKNGADEKNILEALQDTVDLSKNHSLDDMFMSTDEIAAFEETMTLPTRYSNMDNQVAMSGLVPNERTLRIYNKETGELFYSTKGASEVVEDLNKNVPRGTMENAPTTIKQHTTQTATEQVAIKARQLADIKGVVKGEKTIAETGLMETVAREKETIVNNYVETLSKDLPDDLKEIASDDEYLEWFVKNAFDEDGNIIPEEVARYVGNKNNMEYSLQHDLTPKDLRKYDNVTYNSVNAMPKVQFSKNYSKTVRQALNGFMDDSDTKEYIIEAVAKGKLSDDGKAVATMMINGKKDTVASMLLNAQFLDNPQSSPVLEVLRALQEELPAINASTKDFRKNNVETLVKHLDSILSGTSPNKFSDEVKETMVHMENLKAVADAKSGKFYSTDVVKNLMKAEINLPLDQRTISDIYTDVVVDADGVATQFTYDPYTMETTKKAISQSIVEKELVDNPLLRQENMSQLDHFLEHAYKSDVLDKQFTDFVTNTYNVPKNSKYVVIEGTAYAKHMDLRLNLNQYDLADEMKHTLQFVFDELKTLGMREHTANKLGTMLNAYVPHIINKEMFKNPKLMKALQKNEPELYRTIFKSGGDKFNPNNIGRSGELEEVVKRMLGERYTAQNKVYTGTGKTVQEVNEAFKPLLKSAGFDGDFFINNLYDAFAQRVVTHGDVLYSDKIIDETLSLFGKYVSPGDVKVKDTYYVSQKDISKFFKHLNEDKQYILLQELGIDLDKTYNKMLIAIKGKEMQKFYNVAKKWKEEIPTLPNFVAYNLPEGVANFVQNKGYTQALDDTNVVLKAIDKFTVLWKQTATVINPGFHIRNKISNTFNTYLNCGADTFNPQVRNTVKEILNGKEGVLFLEDGSQVTYQTIRDQMVARDIVSYQNFNRTDSTMGDTSFFGAELRGSGGVVEAIGRMLGKENPSKLNKLDPTDTANFIGFEAGRKFGGGIEDFDRTLNFVSRIRQGESFDVAHDMVNKFLFDYSDLTPFEMNVMKRIIPFYTWIRKNAPLQVEMLFEKPWVYSTMAHTQREANRDADQTHLPSYMKEWFRLPVEFDGKEVYANVSLPYQDLFTQPTLKDTFGMLNPLIKMPVELAANKNIYFDTEIWNENDTIDEFNDKIGKYVKTNTLGGYNSWLDAIEAVGSGEPQALLEEVTPLVTGITPKVYDKDKSKEDAIYRAIRNMETKFEEESTKKKSGLNQNFEEYKATKLEKYGYKEKSK